MARIRHLAIVTEDVDRMAKFYTNVFGLKVVEGVGPATYLTDGYLNLALIPQRPGREKEGGHPGDGVNHFGIEVDDIEALAAGLKEWGASSKAEKRPDFREAEFRVKDPDGNAIDLSQHGWPH